MEILSFLNQVLALWNALNTFYRVSFILLFLLIVIHITMCSKSSRWKKLGDDYKVLMYNTLVEIVGTMIPILMMYIVFLYPIWWLSNNGGRKDIICGWCLMVVPFVLTILWCIFKIYDYRRCRQWIQLHKDWEGSLGSMRSLIKGKLSSIWDGYLVQFVIRIPINNGMYPEDGKVEYVESVDVIATIRKTINVNPVIGEIRVLSRDHALYKRISEKLDATLFEGLSINYDQIKWRIVYKKDGVYYVLIK